MKWFLLILIFVFAVVGTEIYQNVELVRDSYNIQKLKRRIEKLKKENELLRVKISNSLSLKNLGRYAREELKLSNPREVRILKAFREEKVKSSRQNQRKWSLLRGWPGQKLKFLFDGIENLKVFMIERLKRLIKRRAYLGRKRNEDSCSNPSYPNFASVCPHRSSSF